MRPHAIAAQKGRRAAGASTGGRPGDRSLLRVDRADFRRPVFVIVHLHYEVLRRPIESAQYTSLAFGARCATLGVRPSRGTVGDCYDNALCESFFATLECELLDRRTFRSHAEARTALFQFIEGWYNPHRRHSTLGYVSPMTFEQQYYHAA